MNIMANAHKATRILVKAVEFAGIAYREIFKAQLKLQHKRSKMTVTQLLNDIDTRAQEYACPHLPFPSQLAYSFSKGKRIAEVYSTVERGLFVVLFYNGGLQCIAQVADNAQAKEHCQDWMKYAK